VRLLWNGIGVPRNTPTEIIDKPNNEIAARARGVGVACGDDASAGWRTIAVAAVIQGQVGLETSNNIIEKGLALRPRQSGSVVASTGY
jgi:hypothetical protein